MAFAFPYPEFENVGTRNLNIYVQNLFKKVDMTGTQLKQYFTMKSNMKLLYQSVIVAEELNYTYIFFYIGKYLVSFNFGNCETYKKSIQYFQDIIVWWVEASSTRELV